MKRNQEDIKYVEVSDDGVEWVKRIPIDTFKDGSCRAVRLDDEQQYMDDEGYRYVAWDFWREIKKPEYVPFDFNDDLSKVVIKYESVKYKNMQQSEDGVAFYGYFKRYDELLCQCTIDGHPAGKLKED